MDNLNNNFHKDYKSLYHKYKIKYLNLKSSSDGMYFFYEKEEDNTYKITKKKFLTTQKYVFGLKIKVDKRKGYIWESLITNINRIDIKLLASQFEDKYYILIRLYGKGRFGTKAFVVDKFGEKEKEMTEVVETIEKEKLVEIAKDIAKKLSGILGKKEEKIVKLLITERDPKWGYTLSEKNTVNAGSGKFTVIDY